MCACRNLSGRIPEKVEFSLLLDGVALTVELLIRGWLILSLNLRLLFKGALECVSVLEVPSAGALRFVVREGSLEVEAVGVDPLTSCQASVLPVAGHLHACLLEHVCAVAHLLSILPPAGVNVTIFVGEDTLTVATSILPIAVILTDSVVDHFADTILDVVVPAAFKAMERLGVAVDTCALTLTVDEVTLIDIAILVSSGTEAGESTRARLSLVVLGHELVLAFAVSVLRHSLY